MEKKRDDWRDSSLVRLVIFHLNSQILLDKKKHYSLANNGSPLQCNEATKKNMNEKKF